MYTKKVTQAFYC